MKIWQAKLSVKAVSEKTNSFLTSRHCPFGPPPVQCGLRYIPETKWQKCLQDMCENKMYPHLCKIVCSKNLAPPSMCRESSSYCSRSESFVLLLKWQGWESPLQPGSAGYNQLFGSGFFLTWGSAKAGTWCHMSRLGMVFNLSFFTNCGAAGPGKAAPWWQW